MKPFRFLAEARAIASERRADGDRPSCRGVGIDVLVIPITSIPQLAPISAMAAIAAATERLRISAFVLNNDLRHPAVLAQELASLDVLSEGRLDVAIGAGWNRPEYEAIGLPFDPTPVRQARLAEAITVLKGCFADGPFSFAGEHYRITDFDAEPKPVQRPHPPFFIGGGGRRRSPSAAREAQIVGLAPRISRAGGGDPSSVTVAATAEKIGWVREAAGDRFDELELNVYPSMTGISITDQPLREAARSPIGWRSAAACGPGRAAGVAAHLHRFGRLVRREVPALARRARHQLDHGRRGRRDGPRGGATGRYLSQGGGPGAWCKVRPIRAHLHRPTCPGADGERQDEAARPRVQRHR